MKSYTFKPCIREQHCDMDVSNSLNRRQELI